MIKKKQIEELRIKVKNHFNSMGKAYGDTYLDAEINDTTEFVLSLIRQAEIEAKKQELHEEVIPIFDSLFTDGDYRKSFYEAIEERIGQLQQMKEVDDET